MFAMYYYVVMFVRLSLTIKGYLLTYLITYFSPRALFAVALLRLVQFLNIYISRGSVATRVGCGGIFNNSFILACPRSVPVKEL